ncbi:hypothetical protein CC79DRAFT_1365280 [Sarocladium strictum]
MISQQTAQRHLVPKAKHRRSRHGCLRCKGLKIKCDQQRPGCRRCDERNLHCPGYAVSLRWATKNQLAITEPLEGQDSVQDNSEPRDPAQTTISAASHHTVDLSLPQFDVSLLPGWLSGEFLTIPSSLDDNSFLLQEVDNLEVPSDGLERTMDYGSGISDWATPGSMAYNDNALSAFNASLGRPYKTHRPDIPVVNDNTVVPAISPDTRLGQELICRSSALVEFFFKEVVSLYCAWDTSSNKMRELAQQRWQSSPSLYHTIQSMAAACLAERFPHLASTATSEHCTAMQYLVDTQGNGDKDDRMLALILLGPTSSWHDPGNLARGTLQFARRMLHDYGDDVNSQFFEAALDYWTMMLSFMTDTDREGGNFPASRRASASKATTPPHPFTGISQNIVKILSQVGALVYRQRTRKVEAQFMTEDDLHFFKDCIRQARNLERQLLLHSAISGLQVDDLTDPYTTVEHLEKMDNAYRYTGLLQIYRCFPDLLAERYSPWREEDVLHVPPTPVSSTREERDAWLRSLAVHILGILREIPFESRTRCLQPFIMVACSSELTRLPESQASDSADGLGNVVSLANIELMRARDFIQSRLASYRYVLPLPKVRQVQKLVEEVWLRLDNGTRNVYWLDVCLRKGLVTLPS